MNASTYRISLDIQSAYSYVSLDAKKGDTHRRIIIALTDGGLPYQISPECYAVFTATKPDGNKVFNYCAIVGNEIYYAMTPQTVSAEGLAECEIKIYGADDALLTSACFSLVINGTAVQSEDDLVSETEVNALTKLISDAAEAIYETKETTKEAKEVIQELEDSIESIREDATDAKNAAVSARASAIRAEASATSAAESAQSAAESARIAEAAEVKVGVAQTLVKNAMDASATAMEAAKKAQDAADAINPALLEAKIAGKADDLFFDNATNLLYLTSEGSIIGSGVRVATTGGGGGGGGSTTGYTIDLKNLLESRVITVAEGKKVELKFSYTSADYEGLDDGPGIGRIIVNDITKQTFTAVQGTNIVDITSYLTVGSNTVKVQVENSESAKKTINYVVTVAAAYLTSNFDVSSPFTGDIPFTYIPTGIATKTVHFELDGEEIGTATVTSSGRQQNFTIPAQPHGAHSLVVWFECDIEGTTITSNEIRFAIICIEEGNTTPIIAVIPSSNTSVEQYTNIVSKYRVYDPTNLITSITLEANGEVVSTLNVDRTEQTWTYRPMEVGELEQTIRCGNKFATWTYTITESTFEVEAETNSLALYLTSYGRSNSEENPGVWRSGNVSCEFQGFNFVSDGWMQDEDGNTVMRVTGDARLVIPYRIFASDFRTSGKTIEFELATREVLSYDAEVINCFGGGRGFYITAQQLKLASEQSQIGTRYKEDEHIRVTFVVEKKSENRLILCYINGIMSGAVQYPDDDDFSQINPADITIGSNLCTTDIYNIRVYDNSLTRHQILDNWIADTQNPEDRLARFSRNQIYDEYGRVVVSKLPTDLCYLIIQSSELPQYKGDKKTCNGYFVDLLNQDRSFTFQNAEIDVQGTSSQYYYRKNYKIKFKNGFILSDGSTVYAYQMNDDAVPTSTFTMKADVASSEGAFNVVLAMLYDDLCPYKTPAQEADPRVRQAIEGFPMVMFWDNGDEVEFLGKYNFNNDKGTEEVFGFQNGDESWEILQNGTDRVGWHSADFSHGWQDDFEARYPDKNTNTTRLQALARWLVSTDTDQATGYPISPVTYDGVEYTEDTAEYRLAKFSAELADHFVEEAVIFYYLFTEIFLSIDQREKNAFPTYIASLDRWIVLFYDADSSLGTDNKGNLAFDYYLEDIDYTEGGDPIYNGQNSVLWKNLRLTRGSEIAEMYQSMRVNNTMSYESVIGRFEAHQGKWPEAIFNEDMYTKCLAPLIEEGDGIYLPMLQGKKEQWMKWWLYNRFRYLDSKYITGTSMENRITIRAHQKANVFLTSYVNMYGHVYFNAAMVEHRMNRNVPCEFEWPASGAEDPVIGINDADVLTSLGDLSPHMVELIDVSGAPHITELKVGDSAATYKNYSLNSITLGNNVLLRTLDLRNCPNLTQTVDISGCTNIEYAYFDGTSIAGVNLPNGGILKVLHLPGTIANLTIRNHKNLQELVIPRYENITTLRLENNGGSVNPMSMLGRIPNGGRVRIIGFSLEAESGYVIENFITKLNTMRGMDENGNNTEKAQVSGNIHTASVTGYHAALIAEAMATYPELKITYDEIKNSTVRFYNGDALISIAQDVPYGSDATYYGETPTKPGVDFPEDWAFTGWIPEPTNVQADMDCYAQFEYIGYKTLKLVERTLRGAYENDRITYGGDYAFYGCAELTSLKLPNMTTAGVSMAVGIQKLVSFSADKLTEVPEYGAFSETGIAELYLPSVVTIKNYSLNKMNALKKVDLPVCTNIGYGVFTNSTAIETLIIRSGTVCTIGDTNGLKDGPIGKGTGYIYVPRLLVDSYKAATNWSSFATQIRAIVDYPEICGGE